MARVAVVIVPFGEHAKGDQITGDDIDAMLIEHRNHVTLINEPDPVPSPGPTLVDKTDDPALAVIEPADTKPST